MWRSFVVLTALSGAACFKPVETRETPCPCATGFECCPVNVCRPLGATCRPPTNEPLVDAGGGGGDGGGAAEVAATPLPFQTDGPASSGLVLPAAGFPASFASVGNAVYVLARLAPGCAPFSEFVQPYQPMVARFDIAAGAPRLTWTTVLPAGVRSASFVAGPEGVTVAGTGALEGQQAAGGRDAFVMRVRPDGTLAWVRQFGTLFDDSASSYAAGAANMVVLSDGRTLVAGTTSGALAGQPSRGGVDAFVAALSADGRLEWVRQLGSINDDASYNLVEMADGTVVLAGSTDGVMEPGHTSLGRWELFLTRLDLSGTVLWTHQHSLPAGPVQRWGDALVVAQSTFLRLDAAGTVSWTSDAGIGWSFLALDEDRAVTHGVTRLPEQAPSGGYFELNEQLWFSDGGMSVTSSLSGGWPQLGAHLVSGPLVAHTGDGGWYAAGASSSHPDPLNVVTVTRQAVTGGAREELRTWVFAQAPVAQEGFLKANIGPTGLTTLEDGSRVLMGFVFWGGCLDQAKVWLMRF